VGVGVSDSTTTNEVSASTGPGAVAAIDVVVDGIEEVMPRR
jgi:hypothetical protein